MKKLLFECGVILLWFAPLGLAQAADFVNQPLSPTLPGEFSNLGEPASITGHQQGAETIDLTQLVTVRSLTWSGRYGIAQNLATAK